MSLIENKSVSGIITDIHKTAGTAAVPLRDYLLTELRVMVTYIRLFFLPINETLDYDYPIYHSFLNREVFLSFLFLLMILGFGIYLWLKDFKVQRFKNVKNPAAETAGRQTAKEDTLWQRPQGVLLNLNDQPSTFKLFHLKLISFGIFWFFITSSVETIFIPISPDLVSMTGIPAVDVIFDHRIYLPSIGIIIASSITLFHAFMHRGEAEGRSASELIPMHTAEPVLPGGSPVGVKQCGGTAKRKNGSFSFPTIRPCLLATIIIALSIATYQRNALWGNEISFWEDVVRKSPLKARDHNNLGNTYYDKGLNGNAIEQYQTAVRLQSDWVIPHFNLGQIYFFRGEMEKARSEFEITLQINPQYYEAQRFLNYITKQYRGQIN
ncbi:MAG: tetratricopeptide repeat protein [Nitrospirae bacterium]|nr:tetratricopeptide repeat protein [Nitrospirota bacterium]